jgi:PAS domain S-box-containing protein
MPRSKHPAKRHSPRRESKAQDKPSGPQSLSWSDRTALLHDLFDDLEVGFANVTPSGDVVYANRKFAMTLGSPPHREVIGMNLHDFISPHGWNDLDSTLRRARHEFVVGEIKLNAASERPQTIRLSMSPASILGEPVIRVVADEVTELVEANLQLRDTEASLRALSGRILQLQDQERRKMARDLHDTTGQELAVLVMSLRHLAEGLDRSGIDLHKALSEAAELAQKVNDEIRTLSYVLHPPLLDQLGLGSALKWYVEGFSKRSSIDVMLVIPDDLQRFSSEKETALFRVVQEGLTNVLRHSGSARAKIVVCSSIDEVEVTVKDEGKGLSAPEIEQLSFGPGNSGKAIGVGIAGLRERLHQLGGKLQISSNRAGTTLKAVLSLDASDVELVHLAPEKTDQTEAPPVVKFSGDERKRILVVDDHEVMRRGIRNLLENCPELEVCGEASSGFEAIQKARELHPDLIILDLNMPGSGGLSAANELQHSESCAKILIFTMHTFPGLEKTLRAAGCKGFVAKVNAERDLLRGIRAVLEGGEFFGQSSSSIPVARAYSA